MTNKLKNSTIKFYTYNFNIHYGGDAGATKNYYIIGGEKNLKVIKSIRLANYLTDKGFKIAKTQQDRTNNKYLVFLFEYTKELDKQLHIWTVQDQYTYK